MVRRILVGCECSSTVTAAFRARGIEAFSCDLSPCYGSLPEYHFQGDVREVFGFVRPDLFIAHPPCTYLSNAGLCRLRPHGRIDWLRWEKGLLARDLFLWCLSRPCLVAVENPVPISLFKLPAYTQIIQPYEFGEPYSKRTCLWLRGLPPLLPTFYVRPSGSWVALHSSPRIRAKTFDGVAAAMAAQWGGELCNLQLSGGWI